MFPKSNSNDDSDDYVSDGQAEEMTPQRSQSQSHSQSQDSDVFIEEAPEQSATQSSSSSEQPDEIDRFARQTAEEATLKKTGWLLLRTTDYNLTVVLEKAGVKGLHVAQLYNTSLPSHIQPCAFLLLYKWAPDRGERIPWNPQKSYNPDAPTGAGDNTTFPPLVGDDSAAARQCDVIFCEQTMDNASATQALVLALLNIPEQGILDSADSSSHGNASSNGGATTPSYDVGNKMRVLKNFLKPLDPTLRAAAVTSSEVIRNAHNAAARDQRISPDLLDEDGKVRTALLAEELWMYSVFVPTKSKSMVYEMEGMSNGARVLAHCSSNEWVGAVFDAVEERMDVFRQHNIPFLLFVLSDGEWRPTSKGATGSSRDLQAKDFQQMEEKRVVALHNYEKFFLEMLKLMASRGDITKLIRDQESSRNTHRM